MKTLFVLPLLFVFLISCKINDYREYEGTLKTETATYAVSTFETEDLIGITLNPEKVTNESIIKGYYLTKQKRWESIFFQSVNGVTHFTLIKESNQWIKISTHSRSTPTPTEKEKIAFAINELGDALSNFENYTLKETE